MGISVTTRFLRPSKRSATDNASTANPLLTWSSKSNLQAFSRPVSALARYRPHKLSEIREGSSSSRLSLFRRHSSICVDHLDGNDDGRNDKMRFHQPTSQEIITSSDSARGQPRPAHAISRNDTGDNAHDASSLPIGEIPKRRSSMSVLTKNFPESCPAKSQDFQFENVAAQVSTTEEKSTSPVRQTLDKSAQSSDNLRSSLPPTFVRTTTPFHLLDDSAVKEPRVNLAIRLPSSLFVGGGTIEGHIELQIDECSSKKTMSKPLSINKLSVDIIGMEEVEDGRRRIFLSLATELFDRQHPPPSTLVASQALEKGSGLYWRTRPGAARIPFCVNLPLKLGPPPYTSRRASIRYMLCPAVAIKVGDRQVVVHQTWSVQMLTTHDPERALACLPNPLLATDSLVLRGTPVVHDVKLTAGIHRQTWVSGGKLFIDIHVVNHTDILLKRIDLQVEKSILFFSHSAVEITGKSANNLRLPSKIDTETVSKTAVKRSKEWQGIMPQAAEIRTCEVEIPKGHVTVGGGRYFEVRYFIKVTIPIPVARHKPLIVKLPITIIHIHSLDVVPNSAGQVAASIEAKRAMMSGAKAYQSQGQTFVRRERQPSKSNSDEIRSLMREVDASPRQANSCTQHLKMHPSCYHCHLLYTKHADESPTRLGPRLPRLQVSTSGLGFTESEFEISSDSPFRKVMLSEKERQMISQQRELQQQRAWSQQNGRKRQSDHMKVTGNSTYVGWRNVTTTPSDRPDRSKMSQDAGRRLMRQLSQHEKPAVRVKRKSHQHRV